MRIELLEMSDQNMERLRPCVRRAFDGCIRKVGAQSEEKILYLFLFSAALNPRQLEGHLTFIGVPDQEGLSDSPSPYQGD
jgi:hypothetical protein